MAIIEDDLLTHCSAEDVVGSYPGEWHVSCELPMAHQGLHRAVYEWKDDINTPVEWPYN